MVFATLVVAQYMISFYAPIESEMGVVQKIFYYHVPAAWNAFVGFFLVFIFSFSYLRTHNPKWDRWAHASAEVGVLFTTIVLISGPIWAKPVWGIWWTWDARLTLTFVLWLTYLGYLMLRHYVESPERRATLCAVTGIVGFVNVPLVYFAIRWWRTQHPQPVVMGGPESGLDPQMATTLYTCFFAFLFLFLFLTTLRASIGKLEDKLENLEEQLDR